MDRLAIMQWQQLLTIAVYLTGALASTEPSYSSEYSSTTKNGQPRPVYLSPSKDVANYGPQYLAAMINQLSTERSHQIMGPTPVPEHDDVPPLSMSHGQLSTLYKNAVKHLNNLDLSKPPKNQDEGAQNGVGTDDDPSSAPGYYYYYFPMTDMPDEASTESSTSMNDMMMDDGTAVQTKQVEPLFVAIASFVGLSTLFAFSVLFLPKFGSRKRSETSNNSLVPLTNVVMEALESGPERRTGEAPNDKANIDLNETLPHGCPTRLACEVGRALRKMKLHRGPLRALERILPADMGKHVQRVRESAHRRDKCSTIRCDHD